MDVFDLVAKIRLDSSEYESGIGQAKGTFSNLASGVKTGLATVAKVGAAAVAAGVTAVTALTKASVEGYAQYEQLVGGVETLFKDSQGTVIKYAENAYKTAGMSANEYMETVTSFSASLIQSLDGDTAKAAEVGNMAITDMSDNANKMGTSMEMIQNAYNGFAKQNYTMLDNLKLGYGGTKEEMQRLIDDANRVKEANGEMGDLSIESFADVTEAIHVMQTEMGITGTTAREASSTIEGSISMMKGAWQNLVVGMADENANMEVLINNFVESTATAAHNLIPRIAQALEGIGQLITGLSPVIAEALPVLVAEVLPTLLAAGVSLVTAIVDGIITALPALYTALMDGLVIILTDVFGVSEEKANAFADGIDTAFGKVKDAFGAMVESAQTEGTFLNDVWTGLQETGQLVCDLLVAAWDVLSAAFTWCVEQIQTEGTFLNLVWEQIQTSISAAVDIINGVIQVFVAVLQGDWSGAWEAVKNVAQTIWDAICDIINAALEWLQPYISGAWEAIKTAISTAVESIKTAISEKFEAAKAKVAEIFDSIKETLSTAWEFIKSVVQVGLDFIVMLISAAFQLITLPFRFIWENCKETILAAWDAIKTAVSTALDAIKTTISNVWNAISSVLSPILNTIKTTISNVWNAIKTAVSNVLNTIKTIISTAWNSVSSTVSSVLNTIKSTVSNVWNNVKTTVSNAIDGVKTSISTGMNNAKSAVSSVLDGIKSKFTTIWDNCKSIVSNAVTALKNALKFEWSLPNLKLPHISVSGGEAPYGIGGKGSLPSFSIEWYKKAYDNAMVLSSPTIFGFSGNSFLGGGDGNGNEIVAGESHLMNLIGQTVESKTAEQNERIVSVLTDVLEAIVGGNEELRKTLLTGQVIKLNEREFGRAVRNFA